jgi:thioredoxin-related protein
MNRIIFLIAIVILVVIDLSYSQEKVFVDSTHARIKFDPLSDPAVELRKAIAEAQKSRKNILLDVGGEWCIWCHRLDEFFYENEDLNKFLHNNFVEVKVNYSPQNKNEKFLSKYPKVAGYPHLFILDKDGRFLHSQDTGKLEEGKGYNHDKVLSFLKEWAPSKKHFNRVD